jgi:hypothetical protein
MKSDYQWNIKLKDVLERRRRRFELKRKLWFKFSEDKYVKQYLS